MKNNNLIGQAIAIFQELQDRRSQLQAEIEEIDRALGAVRNGDSIAATIPAARPVSKSAPVKTAGRRGRGNNAMPLREAVAQVLASGPKTKEELLSGVRELGYRFATSDPANSLQAFLYGTGGKKLIQKAEGKRFALIAGGKSAPASRTTAKAAAPAKAKRNISPAARKRMADAARKMWADRKKAAKK